MLCTPAFTAFMKSAPCFSKGFRMFSKMWAERSMISDVGVEERLGERAAAVALRFLDRFVPRGGDGATA